MDGWGFWIWLGSVVLLPVFFAMGWFAARIDMKAVLKQAKAVPEGFYRGLEALVSNDDAAAVRALSEVGSDDADGRNTYALNLTLGRLYRKRGENDKAVRLHRHLLDLPGLDDARRAEVLFELGCDFHKAGLIDRAENVFAELAGTPLAAAARRSLLHIYQQDRDWEKAASAARGMMERGEDYHIELAQFYCEMAQSAYHRGDDEGALTHTAAALNINSKCVRANLIAGDALLRSGKAEQAARAYESIEKQHFEYLSMAGSRIYDAYDAQGRAAEGLSVLTGYLKTFPGLDLLDTVYEKSLLLNGQSEADRRVGELVRQRPDTAGIYRLLTVRMENQSDTERAETDMMRSVVGRSLQKHYMYRCRHCHFKSQVFFWHCPACAKWETFTPNRLEV